MAIPDVKISGLSIVLIGNFIPSIFHPSWFASKKLIPQGIADAAKVELITPDVAIVKIESFQLTVERNRFSALTAKADEFPLLRDLVLGTLKYLSEIPMTALGINRDFHFDMQSEEKWNAVGNTLAPKERWQGILEKPGMVSVRMQGQKSGDLKGVVNVIVEPSQRLKYGVYVQVNDHYSFEDPTKPDAAMLALRTHFQGSLETAEKIANHLVESL